MLVCCSVFKKLDGNLKPAAIQARWPVDVVMLSSSPTDLIDLTLDIICNKFQLQDTKSWWHLINLTAFLKKNDHKYHQCQCLLDLNSFRHNVTLITDTLGCLPSQYQWQIKVYRDPLLTI